MVLELALLVGPCCIGKTWFATNRLLGFTHVPHDGVDSLHRLCKQIAGHLSAGRSVAFESADLNDGKTRAEVVAFVRQKVDVFFIVKTVWITTASPEHEHLACLWFFGKEVYAAHVAVKDVRNRPVCHSHQRMRVGLDCGDICVRHNVDESWRLSAETAGPACLFLGIHEATYFATEQKKLVLKPLTMRLLLQWFAEPGRIACFVHVASSSLGDRYTVNALAASWHKQHFPFECHLFLCGLSLEGSDEEGEVAPVPVDAASLALLHGLTRCRLGSSVALGSFDGQLSNVWRLLGVHVSELDESDSTMTLMKERRLAQDAGPQSLPNEVSAAIGAESQEASLWKPRRMGHKLGYWHAANNVIDDADAGPAGLCVSLANVVEQFGAAAVTLGCKFVDHGLVSVKPGDVRLLSNTRRSIAVSLKCSSSTMSKTHHVELGAVTGRLLYSYCTCNTSIDMYSSHSRCRHVVAVCVALSRIRVDAVPVTAEEAAPSDLPPPATRTFLYEPQLTEVDADGLPLHMRAPQPKKGSRAATVREPRQVLGPNAPRRPLTPFFFFSNKRRVELMEEQPTLRMIDVARQLGNEWREMPKEAKEQILREWAADGQRFEKEWEEYIKTDEYRRAQQQTEDAHVEPKLKKARAEVVEAADVPVTSVEQFEELNREWRADGGKWICEWDDEGEPAPAAAQATATSAGGAKLASVFVSLPDGDDADGGFLGNHSSTKLLETQRGSSVKQSKSRVE